MHHVTPQAGGKHLPVDLFTGELTSFCRLAAVIRNWNNWSEQDKLLQLSGHLWGNISPGVELAAGERL